MKRFCVLALLAACGDDSNALPDAPPDPCAPQMQLTGEYVDWDSTASNFHGIFGAKFTLTTDAATSTMTAPNGRFIMCIPAADGLVSVEPMAGSNYVAGTIIANKMVIQTGAMLSYRSFTTTRAADFNFDATKGQLFVHVAGGTRTVTTKPAAAVNKHFDGAVWVDGNTGDNIYLGNIDAPTATLTIAGGSSIGGTGDIALTPGAFTYVTIVAR
jgi:hypothetical protein